MSGMECERLRELDAELALGVLPPVSGPRRSPIWTTARSAGSASRG